MNLLEQVQNARIPNAPAIARKERVDERIAELAEWMNGRNTTVQTAAVALAVSDRVARAWLKRLVEQHKVVSWKVGKTLWFSLSQSEIARQKQL